MAFIRPYRPSDEEAVIHVFRETAAEDLRTHPDPLVLHYSSFIWARDYLFLSPSYCFVIDDGNGTAVGYIIAAADSRAWVADFRSKFFPVIESQHGFSAESPATQIDGTPVGEESDKARELRKLVFNPEMGLMEDYPNLVNEYPAHLHIDILASHTSQGWGEKLINTLLDKLRGEGVKGIHLGMYAGNTRAGKFYDRIGFVRFEEMEDKGEKGRHGDGIFRVKKI